MRARSRFSVRASLGPWLLSLAILPVARAEIFHSTQSALRTAFAEADSFETRSLVLSADLSRSIETQARAHLNSRLVRVHVARQGGRIVGYGYLETHTVRSLPETILVAIAADGSTRSVHLLAFHEPAEYLPPARWLAQFDARRLDDELSLRRGIAGIAGSTMTANAVTAAVRRILAIHALAVLPAADEVAHGK